MFLFVVDIDIRKSFLSRTQASSSAAKNRIFFAAAKPKALPTFSMHTHHVFEKPWYEDSKEGKIKHHNTASTKEAEAAELEKKLLEEHGEPQ